MLYICHVISPQLTVHSHKRKEAQRRMERGSVAADIEFAYFTLYNSTSVHKYRWKTEEWEELPPSPYSDSGLVIIDGELTAVGGWDRSSKLCTKTLYTLRQGQWVKRNHTMDTEFEHSSPAVVSTPDGNRILVIGGWGSWDGTNENTRVWTTTVELFHVERKGWYKLTNLPQAPTWPSATICGNQIHVIGSNGIGYSSSLQGLISSNQLKWRPLPQLPVTLSTAATLGGQLIIVGGEQGESKVNSIHQLMDGKWVVIGSMTNGRRDSFVVTPPNMMLIVGGLYEDSTSVEECVVV